MTCALYLRRWVQGVCHRDLRVENLMLDNKGNLKITDFGHAGIFEHGWDVFQTMLVGSVSHLAPEQVCTRPYPEVCHDAF